MKTAFLFSGQGAQYVGMGKELYQQEPIVRQTFEEASDLLGYSMSQLCFEKIRIFTKRSIPNLLF